MRREFELDLKALPQTKSRDKLHVRFDRVASKQFTRERGHDIHVYDVTNVTRCTKTTVWLYRNERGKPAGLCFCEARVICKHMIKTIIVHVARVKAIARAQHSNVVQLTRRRPSRAAALHG